VKKSANDSHDFLKKEHLRNQVGILGVHATYFALDIFVSIFLVSQLLSISDGNLSMVALFYAMCWGGVILMFWLFSYVVKKFSRVWCIRVSTIGVLASIILVLLFQESLAEYYLLLGAIYGLSIGIYWCSMHTFTSEAMGGKKMAGYTTWFIGTSTFVRVVIPLTLGAIIKFVDFAAAAAIATGLAVVLLMFTLILRDQRKSAQGFSMRAFFRYIKERDISKAVWTQFWIQTLYGIMILASVSTTILVAITFNDDFTLGYLTSIFAGASIITLTCYKAIRSPRAKVCVLYILSALPFLGAVGLLFGLSPVTVILCQAGFLTFKTAANSEFERTRLNLMADFGAEHLHTEGLLFTESAFALARAFGLGVILVAYFTNTFYLFQVFVVTVLGGLLVGVVLLNLWTKRWLTVHKS